MRGVMDRLVLRFLVGLGALTLMLPNRVGRWLVGAVLVLVAAVPVLIGAVLAIGGLWLFGSPTAAVKIGSYTGLRIEDLAPARTADGLIVEGDIFNPGPATYAVPALKLALRDAANREVQFRIVNPPRQQLAPGDVAHFRFPFAHPVAAATGVVVTFSGPAR